MVEEYYYRQVFWEGVVEAKDGEPINAHYAATCLSVINYIATLANYPPERLITDLQKAKSGNAYSCLKGLYRLEKGLEDLNVVKEVFDFASQYKSAIFDGFDVSSVIFLGLDIKAQTDFRALGVVLPGQEVGPEPDLLKIIRDTIILDEEKFAATGSFGADTAHYDDQFMERLKGLSDSLRMSSETGVYNLMSMP